MLRDLKSVFRCLGMEAQGLGRTFEAYNGCRLNLKLLTSELFRLHVPVSYSNSSLKFLGPESSEPQRLPTATSNYEDARGLTQGP